MLMERCMLAVISGEPFRETGQEAFCFFLSVRYHRLTTHKAVELYSFQKRRKRHILYLMRSRGGWWCDTRRTFIKDASRPPRTMTCNHGDGVVEVARDEAGEQLSKKRKGIDLRKIRTLVYLLLDR